MTTSCGSAFKDRANSSGELENLEDSSESDEPYAPLTGKMDGVEFFINEDLIKVGASKEQYAFPELQSVFESQGKPWRPSKNNTIPLALNASVNKWIKTFNGPLRSNFSRWLKRAGAYAPVMEEILRDYGMPKDLIYLSMIESGFNLHAYSHASAAGPWQFIKSTGKMYQLKSAGVVDERYDLLKSTRAAARHLKDLHNQYKDWYLAFAAYNAGAGKVNQAIKRMGTRDYWKLASNHSKYLRRETKDYVPKILAAAHIAKNYQKYGYKSSLFSSPLAFEVVSVNGATDVSVIALCSGVSLDEIKFLNPSLILGVTPPGHSYEVLLPPGKSALFNLNYANIPEQKRTQFAFYEVKGKKETLTSVAKHYKISSTKLAKVNLLSGKTKLYKGQTLVIPGKKETSIDRYLVDASTADKKLKQIAKKNPVPNSYPVFNDEEGGSEEAILDSQGNPIEEVITSASENVVSPSVKSKTHRVQGGDTLSSIASKYRMKVSVLKQLNQLNDKGFIKVGQVLKLTPSISPVVATQPPQPTSNKVVTVQRGDTLGLIALKYKVKISDLIVANNLNPSGSIRAGQVLNISSQTTGLEGEATQLSQARLIIHSVRHGETLWDISRKYRVSIEQLVKWNQLKSQQIKPNQKIKIYA